MTFLKEAVFVNFFLVQWWSEVSNSCAGKSKAQTRGGQVGRCESAGAAGRADVIGKTLSGGDLVSKVPKTHSCFLPVLFSLHDKHFLLSWFPSTSSQTFSQTCSSPALFFLLFLYYLGWYVWIYACYDSPSFSPARTWPYPLLPEGFSPFQSARSQDSSPPPARMPILPSLSARQSSSGLSATVTELWEDLLAWTSHKLSFLDLELS